MSKLSMSMILVVGVSSVALAQSVRSNVNDGNSLYQDQKFADAEAEYRKSLEKDNQLMQGYFNLGDALFKQQRYEEAIQNYQSALTKSADVHTSAQLHHNIGNAHLERKSYQESIDEYKRALKLNPADEDTKYNLAYAQRMLKEQQEQKQQKKKPDQKQDKDKKKQQDKQKQDQDKQNQQEQQKQQQQQQQRQQEKQMSRADAQRILDALKNDEKNVQKKLRKKPVSKTNVEKDW